ncbi:MAG: phosphoribosylglycinamide synthetase C domain-containing protein [Gammaproteobacteria bacterium]
MRFLGIGEYNSLGDMYYRLANAGHEVRVFIEAPEAHDIFQGMITRSTDWRAELSWIRAAGTNGIILFESAAQGELQDQLRNDGYNVIGGCAFGDRLESDRVFGQEILRALGLPIAKSHAFDSYEQAIVFVHTRKGRYVYKNNGSESASTRNYVGEMDDGADMIALLGMHQARQLTGVRPSFILMEHIEGIEVGVGAYFNGEEFLTPACLDWEHKRFFPGDLGELTCEMGTIVTYRGAERIFDLTLARMAEQLRAFHYCGYINLNTIVNAQGIWPLEFTCRFGYPGFAICDALHDEGWDCIFRKMITRDDLSIKTRNGFAAGVVLTVPPFPYEYGYADLSKGAPICFRDTLTAADRHNLHYGEVGMLDSQLVTSGSVGYVMVVTGAGETVLHAQRQVYDRVRKVVVPNMRYRTDIGDKLIHHDLAQLTALGYLQ